MTIKRNGRTNSKPEYTDTNIKIQANIQEECEEVNVTSACQIILVLNNNIIHKYSVRFHMLVLLIYQLMKTVVTVETS